MKTLKEINVGYGASALSDQYQDGMLKMNMSMGFVE
jgi:hypothetical protein